MKQTLTVNYADNVALLDNLLRVKNSFDLIGRDIVFGGRRARFYFIDGFIKDEVMEKIMEYWQKMPSDDLKSMADAAQLCERHIPYVEADATDSTDRILTAVLSGTLALLVEGYREAILVDARTYPARGVEEPEDDKVLRGSHDGFVETLIFNTALLRRRIRDPHLTMEITSVGTRSKTDVVLCYMDDRVDEHLLKQMRKRLQNIQVDALALSQESLAECLLKPQWWNPFPKVRYTERPDAATASVYEGNILILIDNSPSVMLLPSSVFDYIQDTNDFYFPPIVGTYLRWVRVLIFVLTIFLTPVWYLLIRNPDWIPEWMSFIKISEPNGVPVIFQLLMIEFVIDGLKLASLNTPSALSNSFSVVGALILGDFAVRANWFVPDVVLYMAFVAIANFAQPSVELGYAFKLFRMLILILTAIGNGWGFLLGIVLMIATIACTQTITGKNYLFPLIPFRGKALASLLIRKPIQHGSQKK